MHEVMSTGDANRRFGVGVVRNNLRRGLWQQPCRGVIVLHNGPLIRSQRLAVVLAAAPRRAALAGPTALAVDGFEGFGDPSIHVVLPSGARPLSLRGVEVHWSTMLGESDVHPLREPRRTRPARSVVDLASWCRHDRYARAAIIASIQQGLTGTRHIRDALARRGPCHRRALIVESVLDAAGGIQSLPERDFDQICLAVGLPRTRRQRAVRGPDGRYFLDAGWDEFGLSVEIHGIPHLAVSRWDADLFRANEIVIQGDRLLIFSSYATRHEKVVVADQLIRMARALGWTGSTDLSAIAQLGKPEGRKFRGRAA